MKNSHVRASAKRFVILKLMIGLIVPVLTGVAMANVTPKELTKSEQRLAAFHDSFELTGESNNCINTRRIRNTRIIDKEHILFQLSHGEYALNKLPHTCHSLRRGRAFAYAPISQKLCSVDTITVLDNGHSRRFRLTGPRCGLGQFSTVKKKTNLQLSK